MPRRSHLCYVVHVPGHNKRAWRALAECRETGHAGCWRVCHVSTAFVACPLCNAPVGHLCRDPIDGMIPDAHRERRAQFSATETPPTEFVNDAFGLAKSNR